MKPILCGMLIGMASFSLHTHAQPIIHNHYHGQSSTTGSLIKNSLVLGCTCALVYGAYDYFFRDGKKILALLKTVQKQGETLHEFMQEKTEEIKGWITKEVRDDGTKTRADIADLKKDIADLRTDLGVKKR